MKKWFEMGCITKKHGEGAHQKRRVTNFQNQDKGEVYTDYVRAKQHPNKLTIL